jgi:hypothetical protein
VTPNLDSPSKDENPSIHKPFGLIQMAGIVGAASAIVVFISAPSSWSFARGLLSRLSFPAGVVTIRSGIDFLPRMAFVHGLVFVVALCGGFLTRSSKEKLLQMTNADRDGDDYVYPTAGSGFVRFVLRDDASYYFVSNSNGVVRAFSVRPDLISQILFLQEKSTLQDLTLH